MDALELRIPPPVVALAVGALIWAVSLVTPSVPAPLESRAIVAAVPLIAGGALGVAAIALFLKARTTIEPMKPFETCVIVDAGVYRLSRNPMYLGITLLLVAWAILLGNPVGLALVAAFPAYITRFQIRPEERALSERFGERYEAYRRRVRRWV